LNQPPKKKNVQEIGQIISAFYLPPGFFPKKLLCLKHLTFSRIKD
jgi:hypothetical protein